jgi:hypothetical protein
MASQCRGPTQSGVQRKTLFRKVYGTILVWDSKMGVGTELTVVQKYGKQDSGTTEHLPSPQGEMKLARFQVPNVKNTKRGDLKYLGFNFSS